MTRQWNEMTDPERRSALEDFTARREAARLARVMTSPKAIGSRELYAYARDMGADPDCAIRRALDSDAALRVRWEAVLGWVGAESFATRAAAATDETTPGGVAAEGRLRYELRRSTEAPFEYVLIVDVDDRTAAPSRLQAHSAAHGTVELALEPAHRGVIQMFLDPGDRLVKVLQDPDRDVKMW